MQEFHIHHKPVRGASFQFTRWLKPRYGRIKLNTDDCSTGNLGLCGGGSLLRDSSSKVIWAIADFYGYGSKSIHNGELGDMVSRVYLSYLGVKIVV